VPEALTRNDVLIAAAILTAIDFVADKIAYIDSGWDAVNTVVRPTAGAVIALLISGDAGNLEQAVLVATGGLTAFATHVVKAGVRLGVNASPEPASNIVVSLLEDVVVTGVIIVAFVAPWVAAAIAAVLLVTGLAVVVTLWSVIHRRWRARKQPKSTT